MKCRNCGREASILSPYLNAYFCNRCFLRIFKRKVFKFCKSQNLFAANEKYRLREDQFSALLRPILEELSDEIGFIICDEGELVDCRPAEFWVKEILKCIKEGKYEFPKPKDESVKPFFYVEAWYIQTYAKLQGVKLCWDEVEDLLEIERRRPGSMVSFLRCVERLECYHH